MEPMTMLALGTAAAGAASSFSGQKMSNRQFKSAQRQSAEQFAAQMDQSIQRRVKDAELAGVHPLFALGASVGASPTTSINASPPDQGGPANALNFLSQTMMRTSDAEAKRNEAEAALMDAERMRIQQDLQSRGRDGVRTFPLPDAALEYGPAEYISPQVAKKQRTGVEAGTHPGSIQVELETGERFTIPSPNLGLDEVGQAEYLFKRFKAWLARTQSDKQARERELNRQIQKFQDNPPEWLRKMNRLLKPWR